MIDALYSLPALKGRNAKKVIWYLLLSLALVVPSLVNAQQIANRVIDDDASFTRVVYPGGAKWEGGNRVYGRLKITLPVVITSGVKFRLEVYNRGKSSTIWINGYPYTNNNWLSPEALILTRQESQLHTAYFGFENGLPTVWIGAEDTEWHQSYVEVAEVILKDNDPDAIDDGWQIDLDSDENFSTADKSIVALTLPIARLPDYDNNNEQLLLAQTSSLVQVDNPFGGVYNGSVWTDGAIKISMPAEVFGKVRIRIEFQERYKGGATIWINGLPSANGFWYSPKASITTTSEDFPRRIHFSVEEDRAVIRIGEPTDRHRQMSIEVAEILYQGGADPDLVRQGWTVEPDASNFLEDENISLVTQDQTLPITRTPALVASSEDINRIIFPAGAVFQGGGTGPLKVQLPIGYEIDNIIRFRLEVFDNQSDQSFSAWISGQSHPSTSIKWRNCAVQLITSDDEIKTLPFRFGSDTEGKLAIWIGTESTIWNGARIHVAEVMTRSISNLETWETGWDITIDNSDFLSGVDETVTSTLPKSQTIWNTNSAEDVIYTATQQVAIGLEDPGDFSLAIDGDVKARRVKVTAENWPDYVFAEDYELADLAQVKAYIQKHGHLPGVPSKAEAEGDGVFVNDMNVLLLEKVEELTLYLLQANDEAKSLRTELYETQEQKQILLLRISDLATRLEKLESQDK